MENCTKCLHPFEDLTINEELLPCKSPCQFIQHKTNKPDKFGLKVFHIVDLNTKYECNGFPYLGKIEEKPEEGSLIVKKLVSPFEKRGHNITAVNYSSLIRSVNYVNENEFSYFYKIRLNKRQLPDVNSLMQGETRYASQFYKSADDKVSHIL